MEIIIPTNEFILLSNGWYKANSYHYYATYKKWVGNMLLEVEYDGINERTCDYSIMKCAFEDKTKDDIFIYLKDMEVALEELKKLEIEE